MALVFLTVAACLLQFLHFSAAYQNSDGCFLKTLKDNTVWHPLGDKCYTIVSSHRTWTAAKEYCKWIYGGTLANAKTEQINDFLTSLLTETYISNAWIGLRQYAERSITVDRWTDGTKASYTNYDPSFSLWDFWSHGCYIMSSKGYWRTADCHSYMSLQHIWTGDIDDPFFCEVTRSTSPTAEEDSTPENSTQAAPVEESTSEAPATTNAPATSKAPVTTPAVRIPTCPDDDGCELQCGMAGFKRDEQTHCRICECLGQ